MAKYIDREMAIEICDWYEHTFAECEYAIRPIADDLKKLPVADVQPVRHGKWEERKVADKNCIDEWQTACCSVCHKYHTTPYMYYFDNYNYCPNCGARMDGEQNDIR